MFDLSELCLLCVLTTKRVMIHEDQIKPGSLQAQVFVGEVTVTSNSISVKISLFFRLCEYMSQHCLEVRPTQKCVCVCLRETN